MNPSDVLQFTLPLGEDPKPDDHDSEVETIRLIWDLCEEQEQGPTADQVLAAGRMTPWVAWQLGMLSEREARDRRFPVALNLAVAGGYAAQASRSIARIFANMLTAGNVALLAGEVEASLNVYHALLRLPYSGGIAARVGAHLAIGSIYRLHLHEPRKAIYHYEHAMRYVGSRGKPEQIQQFWGLLVGLYKEAEDVAGLLVCLCQMNHPQARAAISEQLNGSLDRAFTLRSRLLRQGNTPMADFVKKNWKKGG